MKKETITYYCQKQQLTVTEKGCMACWNAGQKEVWLKRQLEKFGNRYRISRRECKLVNRKRWRF